LITNKRPTNRPRRQRQPDDKPSRASDNDYAASTDPAGRPEHREIGLGNRRDDGAHARRDCGGAGRRGNRSVLSITSWHDSVGAGCLDLICAHRIGRISDDSASSSNVSTYPRKTRPAGGHVDALPDCCAIGSETATKPALVLDRAFVMG